MPMSGITVMTVRYKMTYVVWVGGVDDHYKTKEEAEQATKEWKEKGYDDVILELRP